MNSLNDSSNEQEPSSPTIEEIDAAFRVAKDPTALILPPLAPDESAVGNRL
jgi:hypothetical protein